MDTVAENRLRWVGRVIRLGIVCGLSAAFVLATMPAPAFAGKTERAAKCLKKGDTKVSKGIARKTVKHAIEKWKLTDLNLDEQTIKTANKEVYEFLKWKLGSPTTICGQYVTAGQKHFNKAYGDEAAAALLGMELPGEGKAEVSLPPDFAKQLKDQVDTQGDSAAQSIEQEYGIPPEVSKLILDKLAKQAKTAIDRFGFNWPKGWDVDNRLVEGMIAARRKG